MPSAPERLFTALLQACAYVVAFVPLAAAGALLWTGIAYAVTSHGFPGARGIAATAAFTIGVAASAAVIGGSLGIGCALAAQELAPGGVRGAIEGALAFLGAVPAVAFGWFAVVAVAPLAAERPFGSATQFAAATAVLAAMVAPTTGALVMRALRRVPDTMRQAAAAAGASRLQTTALVILPALRRRIGASVLAAFARAIGEATALQIVFTALAAYGMIPAATTASWIFSTATATTSAADTASTLSFAALALLVVGSACGFVVAREFRGAQWA
jgi:ABC-type phosphate transport system permease subunit